MKHVEKKAFKKWKVIEPFFAGPEDKRTTRIEIHDRLELMFCSFKRRSRVASDVKIVSLKTGQIIQCIPPKAHFTSTSITQDDESEDVPFLKIRPKKMDTSEIDDDLLCKDHVITFASYDLMKEPDGNKEDDRDNIHVVTAQASGLLKEWFVVRETSEEGIEKIIVHLKRTWRSFHQSPVSVLEFGDCLPIQGFVASGGSSDSLIKVWDLNQGYCTHSLKLKAGTVSVISFHVATRSKKRRYYLFASGELNPSIQIFDLEQSTQVGSLDGHVSVVTSLNFLDEDTLLTSSRDKMLITWNLQTLTALKQIPVFQSVEDIIIRKIGGTEVAVIVGEKGVVEIVDTKTGRIIATNKIEGKPFPLKQILSYGNDIVSVTNQNHINFHSLIHVEGTNVINIELDRQLVGELDRVLCCKFVGVKSKHVAVASNSPFLKIYSLNDKNSCQVFAKHEDIILSVQVMPANRDVFMTSSKDNSIIVWRFVYQEDNKFTSYPLYVGCGHFRSVTALCLPSRCTDFALSASEDCIMKIWKIPETVFGDQILEYTGELVSLFSVKAHDKDINSISVAPTDRLFATGSKDKTCKLWTFNPDTKQITLLTTLRGHRKTIWSTDFSPVDKILMTASGDCTIKVWSLKDYSCLRTMSVNDASVYISSKFISNGTQIISSSTDGMIRVFSVKTAEVVLTIDPCLHAEVVADLSKKPFKMDNAVKLDEEGDDEEDDRRIWSLDFDHSEQTLVFGSGSRVFLFNDITQTAEESFIMKKDEQVIHDQKLGNLLQKNQYDKALGIAINLNRPFQCLDILRQVSLSGPESGDGQSISRVKNVLNELRNDQLMYLLKVSALKWNTNSKNCIIAQIVMDVCLPKIIKELLVNDFSQDLMTLKPLVEAMICYNERHETRIKKQVMNSYFILFMSRDVMSSLPLAEMTLDEEEDEIVMETETVLPDVIPKVSETQPTSRTQEWEEELSSGEETEDIKKKLILGDEMKKKKDRKLRKGKGKQKKTRYR